MNGKIISEETEKVIKVTPEETEKAINTNQESATFLVIGDKAYTSEIIEEYNRNAEAKTEAFNTNAENKTASYNSNAADRTTAFNNNYDDKMAAFNSNANTQKEEFDSHVLMQTNTFNNNAASTIANYNSNAEQKTNEFNQNALSYQEGIDANKKHIINVSNELERVKNDVLETGTDTDTYIHLEDSAMAEFQELSVDGVCEQVTTTGSTLSDFNNYEETLNGLNIIWKENNLLKVNGSYSSNINNSNTTRLKEKITLKANHTYYLHAKVIGGSYNLSEATKSRISVILKNSSSAVIGQYIDFYSDRITYTKDTYTPIEDIELDIIQLGVGYAPNDIVYNNLEIQYCLTTDNEPKYEPYTGGQPSPNPDYPQEIKTIENSLKITGCNGNLFDLGKSSDYKTGANTTFELLNNGIKVVGLWNVFREMFVEKNTDYFVSFIKTINSGTGTGSISIYTSNRVYIASGNHNFKFNSGENEKVRIYFDVGYGSSSSDITYTNIQVSKENSQYEQHLETQITANLPEGEFIGKINDTYKDTLKVEYNEEDGQYHLNLYKKVGKVVLDGTQTLPDLLVKLATYNDNKVYVYTTYLDSICPGGCGICDKLILHAGFHAESILDGNLFSIQTQWAKLRFYIDKTLLKEINNSGFITWLSENKPEIYYPLAIPYKLDLGVVDMPITYNEITNIFTDSDLLPQINAKYYRTFEKTIQNLQVNEKALKQELIDINARLSALESASVSVTSESEVVE